MKHSFIFFLFSSLLVSCLFRNKRLSHRFITQLLLFVFAIYLYLHPVILLITMDESTQQQTNDWMKILNLKPHPEGGFYAETYRSDDECQLERFDKQSRSCSTAIYYLLNVIDSPISHFHRIKADEMWHFYRGLPLIIHVLDEEKSSHIKYILSNDLNENIEARPQILISHGVWFAAEILSTNVNNQKDDYTLCGCTCTPGFDYHDYDLAKRSELIKKFPNFKDLIIRLTRDD
ncbi:hypothetical protein I4U23_009165 [Adineta vaga]|nr:hypothetical protein I4U23_009165 [Adineta vaga]